MSAEAVPLQSHRSVSKPPIYQRFGRVFLAYGILMALLFVYQAQSPRFEAREWRSISNSGMTLTIAGMGQTLAVLTGGIDLSVGPMVALSNCIIASTGDENNPDRGLALGIMLALVVGAFGGFINGLLIAYGRLQPIIVTLATG